MANLISSPSASACGTCIPPPPPTPPALITHPLLGLEGGGGGWLALPGRGQGLWGPPGTKVPSWLPGWQEAGTAERREGRSLMCLPERGVPTAPRLSCPLGRCLESGTEPWWEKSKCTPHRGPLMTLFPPRALGAGPWELPAWPVPTPLCRPVGSEVTGSHAPLAHLFPQVSSFCSSHLGPSFLRQEEG